MQAAFASAVVTVQPGPLGVGQIFTADIDISGVTDLYAFQFDVSFAPQVIAATAVTEGNFLSLGGGTFFFPGTVNNSAGTISFIADSLLGPGSGVSGSGVLAHVMFHGVGQGMSPISLSNLEFLDSTLSPIVVSAVAGTSPTIAPEPSSLAFLVCGLMLLGCRLLKRMECVSARSR
jgi:general secretion pathway protein D